MWLNNSKKKKKIINITIGLGCISINQKFADLDLKTADANLRGKIMRFGHILKTFEQRYYYADFPCFRKM